MLGLAGGRGSQTRGTGALWRFLITGQAFGKMMDQASLANASRVPKPE